MKKWIKLSAEDVVKKYLVSSEVAEAASNVFYGRFANVLMPFDTYGQFITILPNPSTGEIRLHLTMMESQFHEWFDDYNPLSTPQFGQTFYAEVDVVVEMLSLIRKYAKTMNATHSAQSTFTHLEGHSVPFVDDFPVNRYKNLQVYSVVGIGSDNQQAFSKYLVISSGQYLYIQILDNIVSESDDSNQYNEMAEKSLNVLSLNKSGMEQFCDVLEKFIKEIG